MWNATLRFLGLVVAVFLIGGGAPVQAQGAFAHGAVVALQGTPHLWIADDRGILHWGGDTRALSGKHVNWNDRRDVSLAELQTYPIGDPWLSAGLLKDGDPIYQVKWESAWPLPKLLHIQSIKDVELFGINGSNYGNFVIDKAAWEQRYGIDAASLERQPLASAVPPGVTLTLAPVPVSPPPATPVVRPPDKGSEEDFWLYGSKRDELTGETRHDLALFSDDFGMILGIRCTTIETLEVLVFVTTEIGPEDPLPGGPKKQLEVHYRFGDGPIQREWWNSSVAQNSAFIPGEGLAPFIDRLFDAVPPNSTRLVIRITNNNGVEYTGVFNVAGAGPYLLDMLSHCSAASGLPVPEHTQSA